MSSRYEEEILRALRRITRAIDIHSRALAQQHQLTGPQLVCLLQIRRDKELTPGVLARRVSLSQATVTGIIDRLVARELVVRERSDEDRRRVQLRLTDSGLELAETAPSPLQQRFAARLAQQPAEQQQRIAEVLREIVHMMEADDLEASPVLAAADELDEA
ncbi:MAG: MarR family transcriptional regulator [Myxococcales bacterium]|nr:MarR family transcriptional regulator [Myxococcales bacterium]